ncbi:MAG: hypothetical protein K1X67_26735 [Fimbriimonadaceae bacterium]|nr:hypothetical protein [Fimbriimonadaceae bacterium]
MNLFGIGTSRLSVLTAAMLTLTTLPVPAEAGGVGGAAAHSAMRRMFAREAARDAATPAVRLSRGMFLSRYATREEAAIEARQGLRAGQHLVGPTERSRVLDAEQARARYGLQHKVPEVRELWYVPKGTPARVNPVWGGARDATEITFTRALPPSNLAQVVPLPREH